MDEFLEDLKSGAIQFRDRWQFELKSEFYPKVTEGAKESLYTQEFYFFIPNALQINRNTYSKEAFYLDLTNFIRYKTPEFSLRELASTSNPRSPLFRLHTLTEKPDNTENRRRVEKELKLFGNSFRSSCREETHRLIDSSEIQPNAIADFYQEIREVLHSFQALQKPLLHAYASNSIGVTYKYIDEFCCNTIDYFITSLLDVLRRKTPPLSPADDELLCLLIFDEKAHRKAMNYPSVHLENKGHENDEILYRSGLLKKFVMDALMLPVNRASIQEQYGSLIASLSAGVAMFVYLLLFVWQGNWFVINSAPFIVITVVAYILKDRLKEALKALSYQRAFRWFSDYTTKILTPDESQIIGELKESFAFVNESEIPEEIRSVRHHEFHSMLETFKRPEQVIYFKRTVKIFSHEAEDEKKRLRALNIILRFSVQDFLKKASDPYHTFTTLNSEKKLLHLRLPKLYHLNLILKNSYMDPQARFVTEINKFRLIVDKNGINEIEEVHTPHANTP